MKKRTGSHTTNPRTMTREFKVLNQYGIHARPAALLVKTANKFVSDISIENGGIAVSGKSIMGLLTLEAHQGAVLRITATGPDAAEAMEAFQELFEQKFFEE